MGNEEVQVHVTITLKEYKELLEIKGRYEELSEINKTLIFHDGGFVKEKDGLIGNPTPFIPCKTDPTIVPPYKITCNKE